MVMGKRVGYMRVSTREQARYGHSLENQEEILRLAGAEEIYKDVKSGAKSRENLEKIMELARARQVDEVIFNYVDRFGRDTPHTITCVKELNKLGIKIKILAQDIDTTTPQGMIMVEMLSVFAAAERYMLQDRVAKGWAHLRKREKAIKPPFGFRVENDRYYLADRRGDDIDHSDEFLCLLADGKAYTKADLARDTIEIFLREGSVCATIQAINIKYGIRKFSRNDAGGNLLKHGFHWSKSGLTDWLHNPTLRGHTCYLRRKERKVQDKEKWDVKCDTHPDQAILNEQQYEQIRATLAANKTNLRSSSPAERKYAITGLIYCSECRAKMYSVCGKRRKNGESPRYFQCRNYRERACTNQKLIRADQVEAAILKALLDRRNDVAEELNEINQELKSSSRDKEVQAKLEELRGTLRGLIALGNNPAIKEAKLQIQNQIKLLEQRGKLKDLEVINIDKYLESITTPEGEVDTGALFDPGNVINLHRLVEAVWVLDGSVIDVELSFGNDE
jgi:DNA invertase Pin-like site-specific DNA recombinase